MRSYQHQNRKGASICCRHSENMNLPPDIVIEVLKKWRFVSTLAAVVSGVYFIYRAYGIYYGHSSLLSTWYANLFTYCMILAIFGMFAAYGDKKNAVTEWLGKISFPVYILHIPVILIAIYADFRFVERNVIFQHPYLCHLYPSFFIPA